MDSLREKLTLERIKRLKIVLCLTAIYLIVEILAGILTGSLALIADAGHMLADAGGVGLALVATNFTRRPATEKRTYGYYRMEILASLTNSVILLLISAYILYEAYLRIIAPTEVESIPMLTVAAIGLGINLSSMLILKGDHSHHQLRSNKNGEHANSHHDESLNIQGAYLEVLSDTLGSVGVIAASLIIYATGFFLADPIVSIGLAIFMVPRAWKLLNKSIHILMENVPANISQQEIKSALFGVKGVTGVFDLHIWSISSGMNALSVHIVVFNTNNSQRVLQEINSLLENKFRISHSTIQVERYHHDNGSCLR
ncbi:MAG: cation diffusion facilitator family transporter [Nitrososphaeraceae archaeon]